MSPIGTRKTGPLSHQQTRTPALITLFLPECSFSLPVEVKERGRKKIEDANHLPFVWFMVNIYFYAFILPYCRAVLTNYFIRGITELSYTGSWNRPAEIRQSGAWNP
jgi:hypothetical protein